MLLLFYVFFGQSLSKSLCSRVKFFCPNGKVVEYQSQWSWRDFGCQFPDKLTNLLDLKCDWYSCGKQGVARYRSWADGCSASIFKGGMDHFFEAICNVHDRCYITPTTTQTQCDNQFLQNMKNKCSIGTGALFSYPLCISMANVAFEVVSSVDQFASKMRMKRSCKPVEN